MFVKKNATAYIASARHQAHWLLFINVNAVFFEVFYLLQYHSLFDYPRYPIQ